MSALRWVLQLTFYAIRTAMQTCTKTKSSWPTIHKLHGYTTSTVKINMVCSIHCRSGSSDRYNMLGIRMQIKWLLKVGSKTYHNFATSGSQMVCINLLQPMRSRGSKVHWIISHVFGVVQPLANLPWATEGAVCLGAKPPYPMESATITSSSTVLPALHQVKESLSYGTNAET